MLQLCDSEYDYDELGNITAITIDGVLKFSYKYDDVGQLVRENNAVANRTYLYTYDNAGNITSKATYGYTTADTVRSNYYGIVEYHYENGWGGRIDTWVAYDASDEEDGSRYYLYDQIGNPLTYSNGLEYYFSWTGRQLDTATVEGYNLSFTYNDEGIRTSKTVDGVTHYYTLAGSQILSEEWTLGTTEFLLIYRYDAYSAPIGMSFRNSTYAEGVFDHYLFVKNIQGDILYVVNDAGTPLIRYNYDAWGNTVSLQYLNGGQNTGAYFNPFRYRGYYYDSELGFYYLNSRYYNPTIDRSINADCQLNQ